LKRSGADWRPDPIQERDEKLQYECRLKEAQQPIASLMEQNESLRFVNQQLRTVIDQAQGDCKIPAKDAIPGIKEEFQRRATLSTLSGMSCLAREGCGDPSM
jgi:regulator of replication initiation timing